MKARQAANTRSTICRVRAIQQTRAQNTTIRRMNSAVLCGSSTPSPRGGRPAGRGRAGGARAGTPPVRRGADRGDLLWAVEVGFEPTEGLPPHTLSRTAQPRPPPAASIPDLGGKAPAFARERLWTAMNETKTETGSGRPAWRPVSVQRAISDA